MYLCAYMEWTTLKHTWFLLPTSIEDAEEHKTFAILIKPKIIGAHTVCLSLK